MHALQQNPTVTVAIGFQTKQLGVATYHRYVCSSCNPQRVGTWLHSSEKVAENAAAHSRWHEENSK